MQPSMVHGRTIQAIQGISLTHRADSHLQPQHFLCTPPTRRRSLLPLRSLRCGLTLSVQDLPVAFSKVVLSSPPTRMAIPPR